MYIDVCRGLREKRGLKDRKVKCKSQQDENLLQLLPTGFSCCSEQHLLISLCSGLFKTVFSVN